MDLSKKRYNPAADLTDDLIVEILSRLPVKSVCRFKCVSPHWRCLITHPDHRKKLPQTLSGFFFDTVRRDNDDDFIIFPKFDSISAEEEQPISDPSLSFLPGYRHIIPQDCCNGLILCLCWKLSPRDEAHFVVCNPATGKFVIVPDTNGSDEGEVGKRRLGFDSAVSSNFHLFAILEEEDYGYITGVDIYSSETGVWSHKGNGWADETALYERSVFVNGMLYFISHDSTIVAVDREGKTWKTISLLETMCVENMFSGNNAFIDQSQGRLHYLNVRDRDPFTLSVWILDNYCSGEWIFKYNISTSQLFGSKGFMHKRDYTFVSIHPECNMIFYILGWENMLMSYDMDRSEVRVISNREDYFHLPTARYHPYVPLFKVTG